MWHRGASLEQLESLYRQRYEHFVRVAAAITGGAEPGRDAVQHAFATAVSKRKSYRRAGSLEAWLWRIVVNEARRLAREPQLASLEESYEPSANGRVPDELGIRSRIAALPERQRETLFLRYYADLDYRAIAETLGIQVGTVSATLSAAHETLRKLMNEVER